MLRNFDNLRSPVAISVIANLLFLLRSALDVTTVERVNLVPTPLRRPRYRRLFCSVRVGLAVLLFFMN